VAGGFFVANEAVLAVVTVHGFAHFATGFLGFVPGVTHLFTGLFHGALIFGDILDGFIGALAGFLHRTLLVATGQTQQATKYYY
tara:strand:- start:68201 stop:68452 length:252 start_codon:yes stop_codon:yes gene_type:complete